MSPHVLLLGRFDPASAFLAALGERAAVSWLAPAALVRSAAGRGLHTVVSVHADTTDDVRSAYAQMVAERMPVTAVHPAAEADIDAAARIAQALGLPWFDPATSGTTGDTHWVPVQRHDGRTVLGTALRLRRGPGGVVMAVSGPEPLPDVARAAVETRVRTIAPATLAVLGLHEDGEGWRCTSARPLLGGGLVAQALRHGCGLDVDTTIAQMLSRPGDATDLPTAGDPVAVARAGIPRAGVLVELEGVEEALTRPGVLAVSAVHPPGTRVLPVSAGGLVTEVAASGPTPAEALHAAVTASGHIRPVIDLPPSHADALEDAWVLRPQARR